MILPNQKYNQMSGRFDRIFLSSLVDILSAAFTSHGDFHWGWPAIWSSTPRNKRTLGAIHSTVSKYVKVELLLVARWMETSQTTWSCFFLCCIFFYTWVGGGTTWGGNESQANSHSFVPHRVPNQRFLSCSFALGESDYFSKWMDLILKVQVVGYLHATSQSLFAPPLISSEQTTRYKTSDASSGAAISNRICTAAHAPRELRAASEQLSPRPPASYLQLWAISTLSDTSMFMSGFQTWQIYTNFLLVGPTCRPGPSSKRAKSGKEMIK